jgi:Flp pilus assembly protein TadD
VSKSSGEAKEAESPEKSELKAALQLVRDGKLAEAIPAVRAILERDPSSTEARHWLAAMLAEQGQHQEAIREYRQVLAENPKHVGTLNNLAYLLATDPDESLRNGKEAVTLATRAWELSSQRNPSILDTLAAAYAESGQFPQAVTAAKSAVAMALSDRNSEVADQIKSRLQWYEMGFPYRDNTQRAIRRAVDREAQG